MPSTATAGTSPTASVQMGSSPDRIPLQPFPSTVVELVRAAVAQYADAPAVSDEASSYTYRELAERSLDVANRLAEAGVRVGDTVAVLMPRDAELVVSVLGVLHAGAAYLPLDVETPAARREAMLRDGKAAALLTPQGITHLGAVAHPGEAATVSPAGTRLEDLSPQAPACVLFTSGSTGTPKGILLEHRNLVWFATTASIPALGPGDRVTQASSPGFDTFTFEVWRTLGSGAELVVTPSIRDMISADLKRELRRRRITAMLAPAAALNHVVRFDRDSFNGLRLLCSGGDVLLPATCTALRAGGFTGTLMNLYGPTETTVACTGYVVDAVDADTVPIGTALQGAITFVLDSGQQPVADGTVGELYVAGAGVGRGYVGQPDLTDARFVSVPDDSGTRMYRTGDLVLRRVDGNLEYHGRVDDQVKIAGVRVEPGEVERALCRHGVAEAAVTAVGPPEDRRLVAFLVPDQPLALRTLRAAVAAELPAQLVPHEMIVVDAIATDHHGKRDWHQLVAIWQDRQRDRGPHVPPHSSTERFLCQLWEDLLRVEQVGVTDDFFALGGHSLLAVRARSAIRAELGVRLPPESIFEHSVLQELSAAITSAQGDQ